MLEPAAADRRWCISARHTRALLMWSWLPIERFELSVAEIALFCSQRIDSTEYPRLARVCRENRQLPRQATGLILLLPADGLVVHYAPIPTKPLKLPQFLDCGPSNNCEISAFVLSEFLGPCWQRKAIRNEFSV